MEFGPKNSKSAQPDLIVGRAQIQSLSYNYCVILMSALWTLMSYCEVGRRLLGELLGGYRGGFNFYK